MFCIFLTLRIIPYNYSSLADHHVCQSIALQATSAIIILFILSPAESLVCFPAGQHIYHLHENQGFFISPDTPVFYEANAVIHGNTSGLE